MTATMMRIPNIAQTRDELLFPQCPSSKSGFCLQIVCMTCQFGVCSHDGLNNTSWETVGGPMGGAVHKGDVGADPSRSVTFWGDPVWDVLTMLHRVRLRRLYSDEAVRCSAGKKIQVWSRT
jgi:hypothetical protein